jgi:cytochrome oxidase Cu insertion factor (SCO1/SenC/PrrC family)
LLTWRRAEDRKAPPLLFFNRLRFFAALLLATAAAAPRAPSHPPARATPPKTGQQAPAFALLDQNRRRVSLADAAGTKVVLVFYRGYW